MRRIDQLLANLGYCSRREAKEWLLAGRVVADGKVLADPGQKVSPEKVRVDGERLDHPGELMLVLHKPLGRVCSHEQREGPTVYELLPARWQRRNPLITSVGRLDKETTGLLLLTDQAALVHRLTSPKHKVPKVYRATVNRPLVANLIDTFSSGTLVLPGESDPCQPAGLRFLDENTAELTLTEGKYHHVRRMFAAVGYEVQRLHREKVGTLELGDLREGEWRELAVNFFDAL